MADSIERPILNIAPLRIERMNEAKRHKKFRDQERSFPYVEREQRDSGSEESPNHKNQKEDTFEREFTEEERGTEVAVVRKGKTLDDVDGLGLVIDVTV